MRRECDRRMHAGRPHSEAREPWPRPEGVSGAGTHCPHDEFVSRPRGEGVLSAPARKVEPPAFGSKADMAAAAASERPTVRLGVPLSGERGRAPRD